MDVLWEILKPVAVLASMGLLFGLGLSVVFKKFGVEPDETTEKLRDILPGANCGGCGHAGCDAFAAALARGEAEISDCAVCSTEQKHALSAVLGLEAEKEIKKVACVHCNGGCACLDGYIYEGLTDCAAAMMIGGGPKACKAGCMGLGSCVKACAFGALSIGETGVACVNEEKCTGCGACVKACPKNLITLEKLTAPVRIRCSSHEKGKTVREVCRNGCIACGLCAKNCPAEALTMEGNLPHIDSEKCNGCLTCVEKCPTHTLMKNE